MGGRIHLGEQVEHGGLARAVGADQTGDLGAADGQVEVIDGLQSAELNAQVVGFQHGLAAQVALGHNGMAGHRDHPGLSAAFDHFTHAAWPPFSPSAGCFRRNSCFSLWAGVRSSDWSLGLLVVIITTISTTAYTSMR